MIGSGFQGHTLYKKAALAALLIAAPPAFGEPFDYDKEYSVCVQQPAYNVGGAAVGDCFNDKARALDVEIDTRLNRASKHYCTDKARTAIAAAHTAWRSYRDTYCGLIETSPDNTPSWIAAGACRLVLARERLESLTFLEQAYMWCLPMSFAADMSHFGNPTGISRINDDPVFSWEGVEDAASTTVRIVGTSGENLDLDTTGCSYCATGADCDDGVFIVRNQTSALESKKAGRFGEAALLHVCRLADGSARLDVVGNLVGRPGMAEAITAMHSIEWVIDDGKLRIVVDGQTSDTRYWPATGE